VDSNALSLLSSLLELNPDQRVSVSKAETLLDVLNHPFFQTAPLAVTAEKFPVFDENGT
jgi:hypothetical protein